MTTTSDVLVQGAFIQEAQTTFYTSTGCKTIMDLATVANTGDDPVTIQVHLIRKGDTPQPENKVHPDYSIPPKTTRVLTAVSGARLDKDDYLSAISDASDKVTIRVSGRRVFPQ